MRDDHETAYAIAKLWSQGKREKAIEACTDGALASVRAEIARLESVSSRRNLLDQDRGDELSRRLYSALNAVVEAVAETA